MKIITVTDGFNDENTYVLEFDTCCAVIDPGTKYEKIVPHMNGKPCTHVLLTHAHFDHITSVAELSRLGAKVYLHSSDVHLLDSYGNLACFAGVTIEKFDVNCELSDGDVIDIDGTPIEVISTPGHTEGSVCYKIGDALFSGDTLFRLSIGRSDFPSGDSKKLHNSINRIFTLEGVECVYPGHGESTTLMFEKENNPYA